MAAKKGGHEDVAVKVAVRCRPLNERENNMNCGVCVTMNGTSTTLKSTETLKEHNYAFDYSYWMDSKQETVYQDLGIPILAKAFEGYNGTIFAYGQTGSGKSFSMTGYGEEYGIIPRMNEDLFVKVKEKQEEDTNTTFQVLVSYLEIYNELVHDLLNPSDKNLTIREHPQYGVYVENLSEMVVTDSEQIDLYMTQGNKVRAVGETKMNRTSSRSHSVFTITVKQKKEIKTDSETTTTTLHAKINLVDLAGSERQAKTQAEGARLKEAANINKSLSSLGNVIFALSENSKGGKARHIPYRDSKLTRLLSESLGGNSLTVMIAAISPADNNFDETKSTLDYAKRAKQIQNKSKKNEEENVRIIRELRDEVERLQALVASGGGGGGIDQQKLLEMEETIQNLEYAKQQAWEAKEHLSKQFESERMSNFESAGLLEWMMENLRNQNKELREKWAKLQEEKNALIEEYNDKKEEVDTLKAEFKKEIEEYTTLARKETLPEEENKQRVQHIQKLKLQLQEENDNLKEIKAKLKKISDQQRAEKEDISATNMFFKEDAVLRKTIQDELEESSKQKLEAEKARLIEEFGDEMNRLRKKAAAAAGEGGEALSEVMEQLNAVEAELIEVRGEKAVLLKEVDGYKRRIVQLESGPQGQDVDQERMLLQYFQVFRRYREAFEQQKKAMEDRYGSILQDAVADCVHLSSRNAELEAENADLRAKLGMS